MARETVEKFLKEYADPASGLAAKFKADAAGTVKAYGGLTDEEQALLVSKDSHEIRTYLKDKYAGALQVNLA
jgi:hypothetical protein